MTEKTFETEYGTIHYWVSCAGEGRPWLVFLPGLTADHHLFDLQIEDLRSKYNCLTWDAPAHGKSRPFELQFTLADKAEYLHEILRREGVSRPVLVGQSMGGYVAQMYMERYPDDATGFVSIDSCPLKRSYYAWWELAMLKHTKGMYMCIPWKLLVAWGSHGTATSEYGRSMMRQFMESYEKREYCQLAAYGYRILAEAVEVGADGKVSSTGTDENAGNHGEAYHIKCPVLLLCGEKDMAGSAKRYNRQWEKREGYRIVWLKGAGHNSNTDVPDVVNELIDRFVSSILSRCPFEEV